MRDRDGCGRELDRVLRAQISVIPGTDLGWSKDCLANHHPLLRGLGPLGRIDYPLPEWDMCPSLGNTTIKDNGSRGWFGMMHQKAEAASSSSNVDMHLTAWRYYHSS
jgi:hypothetical protein